MAKRGGNETGGGRAFVPVEEGRNPLIEGGTYYQWPDAYVEDSPSSGRGRVIRDGTITIPDSGRFPPDLRGRTFCLRPDRRGYNSTDGHTQVLYRKKGLLGDNHRLAGLCLTRH